MSLLLIRHAGSHEAAATSALSSSGMCGGSAAPPEAGELFCEVRATASERDKVSVRLTIGQIKPFSLMSRVMVAKSCKKKKKRGELSPEVVNGFCK